MLNPKFTEVVGTIFVELPSNQQMKLDRFFSSKTLDTKILLEVLRSEQIYGWWDRGEYEFLINVWKLNQNLSKRKRINVVGTDAQLDYEKIKTAEEFEKQSLLLCDRNTNMANIIETTIKTKKDRRNSLFIVGYGHAYKSQVPGGYSKAKGKKPAITAATQLVKRFANDSIFVVLQHVPMGTNSGALGLVRKGLFDKVFEKMGNKPVAFSLENSPFGKEPYDVDYERCFDSRFGNYADNFDGYIFLNPLKNEDSDYILYDIWSEKFVEEMKRRAKIGRFNLNRWLGIKGDFTREKIIQAFENKYKGKKRWIELFD